MSERRNNQWEKTVSSLVGFLCVLGTMAQLAEGVGMDKESKDEYNLLKNGGFEIDEQERHFQSDWVNFYSSARTFIPGEWELTKGGKEGKQCFHMWSDQQGYHGGAYQRVTLEGNRRYKLSAWIKADISKGGKITLLYCEGTYSFMQDGQRTNKWWGAQAGVKKESFDWQYVEKTFETPTNAIGTFNEKIFPVLFYGQTEVWVDDVRLVDMGPVKLGKETYSLSFDDPKCWKVLAHVNEAPASLPEGVKIASDGKHKCDGKSGLKLNYRFLSSKHDAVLLTTDVSIPCGTLLALRVHGDGAGHELDAVLYDKSGEAHYLLLGPVYWHGWKTIYKSIADLCKGPNSKGNVSCEHWGGDGNQTLEFPITRITIGLNDQPDKFQGKGAVTFGWLKIYE